MDDHAGLRDLLRRSLRRDGHVVQLAPTVQTARDALKAAHFDVIVLDHALPDGTGTDLCRELRKVGNKVAVLLLTAHGEVAQRVASLDAGADDFLAKPFAIAELRARVRALGRRGPALHSSSLKVKDVDMDFVARRAVRGGVPVGLTAREWAVMELLAHNAGRVIGRSELLERVWGTASERASASLDVIMTRIRGKIGEEVVRTVRGEGYALDA